jgi:hypothetical protein
VAHKFEEDNMPTTYRIVCVKRSGNNPEHNHIVEVGTGDDPNAASKKWTVAEVRKSITDGTEFHTQSATTSKQAKVESFECSCGIKTIRSNPDEVKDNNLDSFRTCSWKS